jgi:uncharacterized protein involved in exopolysaccharide biosynthesis
MSLPGADNRRWENGTLSARNMLPVPEHHRAVEPADGTLALYEIIFRHWKTMVCSVLCCCAVGAAYCFLASKSYQASGRLLVVEKLPKFLEDSTKVPDAKNFDSLFATHLQLCGSPKIIQAAIEQERLDQLPGIQAKSEQTGSVLDYIAANLRVSRGGSGDSAGAFVIQVGFQHTQPDEARIVVAAVIDSYQRYMKNSPLDGQQDALGFIAVMRNELNHELVKSEQNVREFLKNAPGVWDRNTLNNPHRQQIESLESEMTELQLRRSTILSRIKILKQSYIASDEKPITDLERLALIDDVHTQRLNLLVAVKGDELSGFYQALYPQRQEQANSRYQDLLKLQVEYKAVEENLGIDHPRRLDMQKQIAELSARLSAGESELQSTDSGVNVKPSDIVRAYSLLLERDLQDANESIRFVENQLAVEQRKAKELLDVSLQAEWLQDEYDRSRELYATSLKLLKEQSLVGDFGGYVTEVIAQPMAGRLTWPKKPVILALSFILGVFLGAILAVMSDLVIPYVEARWGVRLAPTPVDSRLNSTWGGLQDIYRQLLGGKQVS